MSEEKRYTTYGRLVASEKEGRLMFAKSEKEAAEIANVLNEETAPLLATIQAQQANLQIAADMLAEERVKSDRQAAEISRFRGAMKDIIDNIFRGKWTPDRVRRYAIEVCQGVEAETEGEA